MTRLRPDLQHIARALLEASVETRTLTVDAIGEALGVLPVTGDEIDELFTALEVDGRTILTPEGVDLPGRLREVLVATRGLAAQLGRRPSLAELAAATGLREAEVRHALSYGRVLGR